MGANPSAVADKTAEKMNTEAVLSFILLGLFLYYVVRR